GRIRIRSCLRNRARRSSRPNDAASLTPADPAPKAPDRSPYELLGGDAGVRALVDAFYDRMDLEEAFAGIRKLHAPSLDHARDKLHWFLSGWLGGPQHYVERFGHPRLPARHLPFPIASAE